MKIKQAETRELQRSQITLASYNPRIITDEARKLLKANLKRIGLLGGIVWNSTSGNLVAGHQKLQIIDEVQKYNPETHENDYTIRVEVTALSAKEEREQNVFMNSATAQGEFDNDLLAYLLKDDFDYKLAGLDESDLNLIITDSPVFDLADYNNIVEKDFKDLEELTEKEKEEEREAKKEAVKEAKQKTKDKMSDEVEGDPWVTLSFQDYDAKVYFMELLGVSADDKYIKGELLLEKINQ